MFELFFNQAKGLYGKGRPFAMAVVVRREAPISGQPGDKAIIEPDGSVHGWIGGGCTEPIIVKEARRALCDGKSRLVRITPESTGNPPDGVIEYAMTCHSGGILEIYIEPVMPKPQLILFGRSAVARALSRLARVVNHRVLVIAPDATPEDFPEADALQAEAELGPVALTGRTWVVVSTQGQGDEDALREVSRLDLPYGAFVASKKKASALFDKLEASGDLGPHWRNIKVPAGLDIGARTPEEIAVSILAEAIQALAASAEKAVAEQPEATDESVREVLTIEDMSCHHCVLAVEKALRGMEGVTVHDVEIGSATISYHPAKQDRSRIAARIVELGYRVGE